MGFAFGAALLCAAAALWRLYRAEFPDQAERDAAAAWVSGLAALGLGIAWLV